MSLGGRVPELDLPAKPLYLSTPIDPSSMTFLYRGQTQAQIVASLHTVIWSPETPANRFWLVISQVEVIATFVVCLYMLIKKRTLGKLWIFARRRTAYGTFYMANAVFVLVLGVASYLFAYITMAIVISTFSYTGISTLLWWWVVPLPWLPLVISAYVSIHGFALACSPRSPLSTVNAHVSGIDRNKWYYFPISKNALLVNVILLLPCTIFTASTLFLVAMSGGAYFRAVKLRKLLIPPEIDILVSLSAKHPVTFVDQDVVASDELIWAARRVTAAFFESHRYVCINLSVSSAAGLALLFPILMYGQPNLVSLVDHACSRHPRPLPSNCTSFVRKLGFLLTEGRPRSHKRSEYMDINTWKMTIFAIIYTDILITCVPLFVSIPMLVLGMSVPHEMINGDITPSIRAFTIAISLVTMTSCTFVAIFCTVVTLDPLFRQVIGLNGLRIQVPVDVQVVQQTQMHADNGPFEVFAADAERHVSIKPSTSTFTTCSPPQDDSKSAHKASEEVAREFLCLPSLPKDDPEKRSEP